MKSAGKARNNGLYRHIRTSKEIIRNLLNDSDKYNKDMHNRIRMVLAVYDVCLDHEIAHQTQNSKKK